MQRDTAAPATPPVIDAVRDLIRALRLAYTAVMVGAESSEKICHVLDLIAGLVDAHDGESARMPVAHLKLLPTTAPADPGPVQRAPTRDGLARGEIEGRGTPTEIVDPEPVDEPIPNVLPLPGALRDTRAASGDSSGAGAPPAATAATTGTSAPAPLPPQPPDLGNEPREDVGRAFRSALLADLARRSTRPASTPPAPRTGPHETTTCPASDASASTTPVRTAMPAS